MEPQIVSCSRRTDIPAYYMDWLLNRIRAGYALTANPFRADQIRRVSLSPEDVRCLVFWSKHPKPLFEAREGLRAFPSYLQFTLNDYPTTIEPLPPVSQRIELFRRISGDWGPQRVVWRYDPIAFSADMGAEYHLRAFERIAKALEGATDACVFSFLDVYAKNRAALQRTGMHRPDEQTRCEIVRALASIACAHGMTLQACAEADDYTAFGARRAACIDPERVYRATGARVPPAKDKGQRPGCGCLPSVDIGAYHTCAVGCAYCYATTSAARGRAYQASHDANAEGLGAAWRSSDR